jgi:hypothetical protein
MSGWVGEGIEVCLDIRAASRCLRVCKSLLPLMHSCGRRARMCGLWVSGNSWGPMVSIFRVGSYRRVLSCRR